MDREANSPGTSPIDHFNHWDSSTVRADYRRSTDPRYIPTYLEVAYHRSHLDTMADLLGPMRREAPLTPACPVIEVEPKSIATVLSKEDCVAIRECYAQDKYNPVHYFAFLALRWQQAGRQWKDHLSGLPLDFWNRGGHNSVSRIAHRIHGLPFCWGWRTRMPTSGSEFVEAACNVVVERRATKWWRGARRGAALFDFLDRWTGSLDQRAEVLGVSGRLTGEELRAIMARDRPITFAASVDPLLTINVYNSTEQAAWWRTIYGVDQVEEMDPTDIAVPQTNRQGLATRLGRVDRAIAKGLDMPWWVMEQHRRRHKNAFATVAPIAIPADEHKSLQV
ncbi:unnamed protein product [Parajaminaea phylloscopi]